MIERGSANSRHISRAPERGAPRPALPDPLLARPSAAFPRQPRRLSLVAAVKIVRVQPQRALARVRGVAPRGTARGRARRHAPTSGAAQPFVAVSALPRATCSPSSRRRRSGLSGSLGAAPDPLSAARQPPPCGASIAAGPPRASTQPPSRSVPPRCSAGRAALAGLRLLRETAPPAPARSARGAAGGGS